MFLPTTIEEARKLGWNKLDVIIVTGDSYIDSPFIGAAAIGKLLVKHGYKVGIIPQPDINSPKDITALGEPELFWGVTAGSVDSMVANYTALKKKRRNDDYTPGGINNRRPDRAAIRYTNLIKQTFKNTRPVVLGGIEASLRRVTHYDYWSDKLRRPIIFDAKADYLVYGMGEKAIIELASKIKHNKSTENVKGVCYISSEPNYKYEQLPSFEATVESKSVFIDMFNMFYANNDPITAKGLVQKVGNRYLIQNPPQPMPTTSEIDEFYNLQFERELHPELQKQGKVKALDTIRFSLTTHRGCYGECNFCAIAVHQGRTIVSRSENSILEEVNEFAKHKKFRGIINDAGGPTANMYGYECDKKLKLGVCDNKRCVFPNVCKAMKPTHKPNLELLKKIRNHKAVRKVFVASGIRPDLLSEDRNFGDAYIRELANHYTSGQLKLAPEHSNKNILDLMGKGGIKSVKEFKRKFEKYSSESGKKQFLTYYFIAAHPGCSDAEMVELKTFTSEQLSISPEQVQVFTPTPSTWSTVMYYTGINPFDGSKLNVERELRGKANQKEKITATSKTGNTYKKTTRKRRQ